MTDLEKKIEYVVKHDPIRYVVKKRWFLFWTVETLEGRYVSLFIFKPAAVAFCDVMNAAYQIGYTVGQQTILKAIFK